MRIVTESQLAAVLAGLPRDATGPPRAVVSGNFATPWPLLAVLDRTLPTTGCSC